MIGTAHCPTIALVSQTVIKYITTTPEEKLTSEACLSKHEGFLNRIQLPQQVILVSETWIKLLSDQIHAPIASTRGMGGLLSLSATLDV
jgi:hypothetical protein